MSVHICAPSPWRVRIRRLPWPCAGCNRQSFAVEADYEWYGPTIWCLRCGESYQESEGGMEYSRPFARGWRAKSKEYARRFWRQYAKPTGGPG